MLTESPFDDLLSLIAQLPLQDEQSVAVLSESLQNRHKLPTDMADGVLSWLVWLAGWQGKPKPSLAESHICLFTSSYTGSDEVQNVVDFADKAGKGQTAVNQLCKDRGLGLRVLELAPSLPHDVEAGWTERECMAACAFGMEATAAGGDLLGLSALSAGAEGVAENLIRVLSEMDLQKVEKKTVLKCMQQNAGREIAALVGGMLAARSRRLPVLAEGWTAIAAMKVLHCVRPDAVDHVRVVTVTSSSQMAALTEMKQQPLLAPVNDLPAGCGLAVSVSSLLPLLNLA